MKKFFSWFKLLSKFVSVQLVVQALNLASGILIVRTLSQQEYAYFTLANSMQATMNILADSGVGSALSAIGGKVWQDPHKFGSLINTAMLLRRYLAVIATTVITPILFWMLVQNGASVGYTILLIIAILIELYFYLSISVLAIIPRLHSQIGRIQNLDLLFSGTRLVLVAGGALTVLNAAVAAFASTAASGFLQAASWSYAKDTIDTQASTNVEDKSKIIEIVKTQAPNIVFYCLQGQITIWLISTFGSTKNIAEAGALGRLGIVFTILNSIMTSILLPSFSRCHSRKDLTIKYCQILFFYMAVSSIVLVFSLLFPDQLLWILGPSYSHLKKELFFFILAAIVQAITGVLWSINASKGWTQAAWLFIPTIIFTQIILIFSLDLSNIIGVCIFSMLSIIPASCLNFYMTYKGLSGEDYA